MIPRTYKMLTNVDLGTVDDYVVGVAERKDIIMEYTGKYIAEFDFVITQEEIDEVCKRENIKISNEEDLKNLISDHLLNKIWWDNTTVVNLKKIE